jgi:hypothetical protein
MARRSANLAETGVLEDWGIGTHLSLDAWSLCAFFFSVAMSVNLAWQ